ncbi:MAG: methyl-accepting chemotaxis protein [Lachnospiraceae bacterium]|nr:methyl-accepting chemotaxis protein [Lachnospiraceae bacterium]
MRIREENIDNQETRATSGSGKKGKKGDGIKYKGLPSIKHYVLILLALSMLIVSFILVQMAVSSFSAEEQRLVKNNMMEMANSYGEMVNNRLLTFGTISNGTAHEILDGVKISGVDSSYMYLVDQLGNMMYHPTPEKIGQPVENEVVKGLRAQLEAGAVPEPAVIEYTFKGSKKLAAYYITEKGGHMILVVSADKDDVLAPINEFRKNAIITFILCVLVLSIIMYFLVSIVLSPIGVIVKLIDRTAALDFTHDSATDAIITRRDETGQITRSVGNMRKVIREIVYQIDEASSSLNNNANDLKDTTNQVNINSSDNSATSETLAAGMEETSANAETINNNIVDIFENVQNISKVASDSEESAAEIQTKVDKLSKDVLKAQKNTQDIYSSVKIQSEEAIEKSKAVQKINALTDTIKSIADQTNLLSLNASIEAARAGESGRGFAVVAEEIGSLATQSGETVDGISEIVAEVNDAVNSMSQCLQEMLDFIDKNVMSDYESFSQVTTSYNADAHFFGENMSDIRNRIQGLTTTIDDIKAAISGINETMGDAANGVTDVAQRTSDVVRLTEHTNDLVEQSTTYSEDLRRIVEQFNLGNV